MTSVSASWGICDGNNVIMNRFNKYDKLYVFTSHDPRVSACMNNMPLSYAGEIGDDYFFRSGMNTIIKPKQEMQLVAISLITGLSENNVKVVDDLEQFIMSEHMLKE